MPTEYQKFSQGEPSAFFSFGQAEAVPATFFAATCENGWHLTIYKTPERQAEDESDVRDSLEALGGPQGISLDDLKRELDA